MTLASDSQGEWILSGRDCCDDSELHLYMYAVKCVDSGVSKDPFLTQVSDFAVLFGNQLDAEVFVVLVYYSTCSIEKEVLTMSCLMLTGVIDVDGSIYRSGHDHKGLSCL